MRRLALLMILPALALGACSDSSTGPTDPEDLVYAPTLGVDLSRMTKLESGVYYEDVTIGDGPIAEYGDSITAHFTGWLHSGFIFDTSYRYLFEPIQFLLTPDWVIEGWVEGLQGVREGGTRKLVIPSELAYGSHGNPFANIPPYATLVFQVDVLEVGKVTDEAENGDAEGDDENEEDDGNG